MARRNCEQADALVAARAEWLRIQRGILEFQITLAYGRADIIPQRPARVAAYKRQIDETPWIVSRTAEYDQAVAVNQQWVFVAWERERG